jgi:hypothetical protein
LSDARVAVVGGNPTQGIYEPHIEIYAPAYLFNVDGTPATRPTIAGAPTAITYGTTFQVQTPDAPAIGSVVLMRPGAPTHAFDMDQRLVKVSYTAVGGALNVTAPPNGSVAPPGYYMLFILNAAGVPSVASFVQLTPTFGLSTTPASQTVLPGDSASYVAMVTAPPDFTETVAFTVSGLPAGTSATFSPGTVNGSGSTTMTVGTTVTTPVGAHQLTITATSSGSVVQRNRVNLAVGSPLPVRLDPR